VPFGDHQGPSAGMAEVHPLTPWPRTAPPGPMSWRSSTSARSPGQPA